MNRIAISTALTLAAATPFTMQGADSYEPDTLNRFSLGARFGINFKADFRNNTLAVPLNPGPAGAGANHQYQDGYVKVDSSGNLGGLTWNWGYENASQVVGDTMEFHSTRSSGYSLPASSSVTGDPQPGLELVYQRVLGKMGNSARWGLEGAFGYMEINLRDSQGGVGRSTTTTDAYQLNGVLPPGAGYNGTFAGPGTMLGDTPTRSTASSFTSQLGQQRLSGQLFTIRLGPFAEWNFTPQLSLAASVGLTLAPASVNYDFSEVAWSSSGGSLSRGHASKNELLYGPYVGGTFRYDFSKHWGVFVGAQFQNLTDLQLSSGAHAARLDPRVTVYGTFGATWRF